MVPWWWWWWCRGGGGGGAGAGAGDDDGPGTRHGHEHLRCAITRNQRKIVLSFNSDKEGNDPINRSLGCVNTIRV